MNFSKVNIKRTVLFISFIFALLYVLNRFIDFCQYYFIVKFFYVKINDNIPVRLYLL